jgi:hypothetical protein
MNLFSALLLVAAPLAPPAEAPAVPRAGVSASVRASVVILRAEGISAAPNPHGVERRTKQTPQGLLVEFS